MSSSASAWIRTLCVRAAALRTTSALTLALIAAVLLSFATILSAETATASSRWTAPIQPLTVVSAFDPPAQRWRAGHRGVDVAGTGTVRAAGGGTVTFADQLAGRGVVSVSHGWLRTTYEPVDATVVTGQTVAAGQPIGEIGVGGHCSGRCLHWGLLAGDEYLDPLLLLRSGPPVLKSRAAPPVAVGVQLAGSVASRRVVDTGTSHEESAASPGGAAAANQDSPAALSTAGESTGVVVAGGLLLIGSAVTLGVRRVRRRHLR